jgi:3-polyprenyl-4-hydroxybenzoate decarboxylase
LKEPHKKPRNKGIEGNSNLEITEIADRVMKNAGPALLFERVKGFNRGGRLGY